MNESKSTSMNAGIRIMYWLLAAWLVCAVYAILLTVNTQRGIRYYQEFPRPHDAEQTPTRVMLFDSDGYYWLYIAERMANENRLRVRTMERDNAPYGRENHWHSGFAWWMLGLAWLYAGMTGTEFVPALETMSIHANPILLLLILPALGWIGTRIWNARIGALLMIGWTFSPQIFWTFGSGRPDHHGQIVLAAMLTWMGILLGNQGWIRKDKTAVSDTSLRAPDRRTARAGFLLSAVGGGIGMWFHGISQIPVLVSVALGSLAVAAYFRRAGDPESGVFDPNLWRLWGRTGALISLAFYFLEYFPHHMSMRLEVNHPIHALAWWGGGATLAWLIPLVSGTRRMERTDSTWAGKAIGILGLFAPLIAVAIGREQWFGVITPPMLNLHALIREFMPYLGEHREHVRWSLFWRDFGVPALAAACLFAALTMRRPSREIRAAILFGAVPALFFFVLTLNQSRWNNFSIAAILLVLGGVVDAWFRMPKSSTPAASFSAMLAGALLIGVWTYAPLQFYRLAVPFPGLGQPHPKMRDGIIYHDIADLLAARIGRENVILLSSPNVTSDFCHFGRFRGISSLYWENHDGLRTAMEIYMARDWVTAGKLISDRGITHWILSEVSYFVSGYHKMRYGQMPEGWPIETVSAQIALPDTAPPPWMEDVPYEPLPIFRDVFPFRIRILEINHAALSEWLEEKSEKGP